MSELIIAQKNADADLRGAELAQLIDTERARTYNAYRAYSERVRRYNIKHPPVILCVTCLGIVGKTCDCAELAQ